MRITKFYFMLLTIVATTAFVGCSDDDDSDTMAQVSVNGTVLFDDGDDFNGDVDGDFTGNGGSATKTFLQSTIYAAAHRLPYREAFCSEASSWVSDPSLCFSISARGRDSPGCAHRA